LIGLLAWVAAASTAFGQAVAVTARFDTNRLAVGATTTLRVYGQVLPAYRATSDRIFSWYIDLLNTNSPSAQANYGALLKQASDNDPQTSSTGTTQGPNRRGIYDTFINLPSAGVASPVELVSVPVTAAALGQTRFLVQAGSGVSGMSSDFIVAPSGGGNSLFGGDYTAAFADLQVVPPSSCTLTLQVTALPAPVPNSRLQLSFSPCPGYQHTIEARTQLDDATGWQPLAGAPHNSGSLIVTNTGSQRFFRVRANP